MWPFSRRRKPPEKLAIPKIEFLGAQDGPIERELKSALCTLFESHPAVERAYLCRVRYGRAGAQSVALALAAPKDASLVDQVGRIFGSMFARAAHLDILFVDPGKERRLAEVCAPFHRVPRPESSDGRRDA